MFLAKQVFIHYREKPIFCSEIQDSRIRKGKKFVYQQIPFPAFSEGGLGETAL